MILSNIKRIRREDIKEAPSWIDRIIGPFNIFVDTVSNAFNKKITFQDNIQCFFKTVEVVSLPFTIANDLPVKPSAVFIAQVYETNSPTATIGTAITVEWGIVSDGIQIKNIEGLTAGTKYTITMLVI